MEKKKSFLIGAHTSAAGGAHNALYHGQKIGATTIQFFTANQKRWQGKKIDEEAVASWQKALKETGITDIMSHNSYLTNLGSPSKEILEKSRKAFKEEIIRCHLLKIPYLNFHPGAATSGSEKDCLDTIVESLLEMKSLVKKGATRLLFETTAGQGTSVGHRFEHLGYLIKKLHNEIPIGVCIDTCHIFAAGYDIRTSDGWDKTLKEFDEIIGLKHLYAFHINDSQKDLGSRRDRHAHLGKGKIGIECFKFLMRDKRTKNLPKYLETPKGDVFWKEELEMLRKFTKKS